MHITTENVIQALRDTVAEFGSDYVYENIDGKDSATYIIECQYVHGDKPGCIVAQALTRNGVSLSLLARIEGAAFAEDAASMSSVVKLPIFFEEHGYTLDNLTWVRLSEVQCMQDAGATWGECLEYVEAAL